MLKCVGCKLVTVCVQELTKWMLPMKDWMYHEVHFQWTLCQVVTLAVSELMVQVGIIHPILVAFSFLSFKLFKSTTITYVKIALSRYFYVTVASWLGKRSEGLRCDVAAGLEGGHTNQPAIFTVETRGAGQGGLGLAIEGPSEAKMNCRDNRDGSCTVEYLPTKPGDYDIAIKFADRPIPGKLMTL